VLRNPGVCGTLGADNGARRHRFSAENTMSEASKAARSAMKSKISRLVRTDPKIRVDASGYEPPDALDADVKTGLRPVSRRQYRRGGKVFANEGHATLPRADKAQRAKGGFGAESRAKKPAYADGGVVDKLENRDVREINRERVGSKHVGGFKDGGKPKKYSGGPVDVPMVKRAMKSAQRVGVDPLNSHDTQAKMYAKAAADKARRAKAGGGAAGGPSAKRPVYDADTDGGGTRRERAAGGTTNAPPEDDYGSPHNSETANKTSTQAPGGHTPGYSEVAVNKAITASNRSGRRIGAREAARIHSVLRGRHAIGGAAITDTAARKQGVHVGQHNPEQPNEGVGAAARQARITRMAGGDPPAQKKRGGAINISDLDGTRPTGGREARATGGRAKGKTNINIIIGAPKPTPVPVPVPGGAPGAPPGPPGTAGLHQGMPPPMPPQGVLPPGAPPMARKTGGRVAHGLGFDRKTAQGPGSHAPAMTHASGGGLGRLQKAKEYGDKARTA